MGLITTMKNEYPKKSIHLTSYQVEYLELDVNISFINMFRNFMHDIIAKNNFKQNFPTQALLMPGSNSLIIKREELNG